MAEKENNQRQENTIDNYFVKTSKGFSVWAEENYEGRSYLQIAAEFTGDADEKGNEGYDFLVSYAGNAKLLADGIAQTMEREEFICSIILTAARTFLMNK